MSEALDLVREPELVVAVAVEGRSLCEQKRLGAWHLAWLFVGLAEASSQDDPLCCLLLPPVLPRVPSTA